MTAEEREVIDGLRVASSALGPYALASRAYLLLVRKAAELHHARAALNQYGEHGDNCQTWAGEGRACTCGFIDAMHKAGA